MNKFLTFILIIGYNFTFSQSQKISIQPSIKLLNDTIISNNLIKSLNGFLELKDKVNSENSFVLKEDLLEMSILLDEMKKHQNVLQKMEQNFFLR